MTTAGKHPTYPTRPRLAPEVQRALKIAAATVGLFPAEWIALAIHEKLERENRTSAHWS